MKRGCFIIYVFIVMIAISLGSGCIGGIQRGVDDGGNVPPTPTPDQLPPEILSVYPAVGALGIPVNATVRVTFTEAMDPSTISAATVTLFSQGTAGSPAISAVSGQVSYVEATNTAIFTPAPGLESFTRYAAAVSGEVTDVEGNSMGDDYSWPFDTADVIAPFVTATAPDDNAEDVEGDIPEIQAQFSEEMDSSTLSSTSFVLYEGAVEVGGDVDCTGDSATFAPWADLKCDTVYTAQITTEAADLQGVPLASDHSWTFTVESLLWAGFYGSPPDDEAEVIQGTLDGGYIITGRTRAFGNWDVWVVKLDAEGSIEWQKAFGGATTDQGKAVFPTLDGGYIVAADTLSFGANPGLNFDVWVLKLDALGNVEWQQTYGGAAGSETAHSIQQISGGNYIIGAETYSFGAGQSDMWLINVDASGTLLWENTYGGANWEYLRSARRTRPDDGFILAGKTDSFGAGGDDLWLVKVDVDGIVQWENTYGGPSHEIAHTAHQILAGDISIGYIVAGQTQSFGASGADAWILYLNPLGGINWERRYGGTFEDFASEIAPASNLGGYVFSGTTGSFGAGTEDYWVVRLDGVGDVQWERTYGWSAPESGGGHDHGYGITPRADGGYAVVGYTDSFGGGSDNVLVLAMDEDGDLGDGCDFAPSAATVENTTAVVAPSGVVAVGGHAVVQTDPGIAGIDTAGTEVFMCETACVAP